MTAELASELKRCAITAVVAMRGYVSSNRKYMPDEWAEECLSKADKLEYITDQLWAWAHGYKSMQDFEEQTKDIKGCPF